MNNILVLYKSKYGATKKYVDMIKKEVTCDVLDIEEFKEKGFDQYDLILFAGGIYAGGISCIKFLRKNLTALSHKKVALFVVGASPFNQEEFNVVRERNLKGIPLEIAMFYGRGGYDEGKMDFKDRTLCRLLKKSLKKKDPVTFDPWMKAFYEAEDGTTYDWTDKDSLTPLLKYIDNIGE